MKGIKGAVIRIIIYLSLIVISGIYAYTHFTLLNIWVSMIFNWLCLVLTIENADVIDEIRARRKRKRFVGIRQQFS